MQLSQVVVEVPQAVAEAVANHLLETGASGIELRDATTLLASTEGRTQLVAFLPAAEVEARVATLGRYLEALRSGGAGVDPWSYRHEPVADEDWRERYKAFFTVSRVGRRLVVCPSWERFDPTPDDVVVTIDPGQAFGTGTHASTRLCLRAIERIDWLSSSPQTVLDLGCGSGLLAVAAARLWPQARVQALDVDPIAVEVARETAERNGVAERVRCAEGSIEAAAGSFDLVLANIQADVLAPMRASLLERLSERGRVVLSGLLVEEAPAVVDAYVAELSVEPEFSEDEAGWRMVILRRCTPS
ncbi:MAG: 50S ribosomal protein L11 methyltransferase [Myxococcota bacterium]